MPFANTIQAADKLAHTLVHSNELRLGRTKYNNPKPVAKETEDVGVFAFFSKMCVVKADRRTYYIQLDGCREPGPKIHR